MYSRELGLDFELIRGAAISSLPALVVAFGAYRLVKAFFYTPAPSGPASLGRAFGFLFSGEVMGAVTIWYLSYVWSSLVGEEFINALRLSFLVLVFVFVSTGAGYLAAHSYEKVGGMNAKIFVVTGFFLHSLISVVVKCFRPPSFEFSNRPVLPHLAAIRRCVYEAAMRCNNRSYSS